jgi:hypothetical protein
MPWFMADQRALDAIARIERALGRIEAASSSARSNGADSSAELARVRDAHQKLRSRVEGAIGQLDRLLETEGRG